MEKIVNREIITGHIAARDLREIASVIDTINSVKSFTIKFDFSELVAGNQEEIEGQLKEVFGREYVSIYSFHLTDKNNAKKLSDKYWSVKPQKPKQRAYARHNKLSDSELKDCFYVGSSRDTYARIRQHLGYGAKATYSLQLADWVSGMMKFV